MTQYSASKNEVNLSDYNFREDISHRLLISDLSSFEATVLHEICALSIQFPIGQLAKSLHTDIKTLTPIVTKFSQAQLLKLMGDMVVVDKELRKYYELHLEKFDNDQVPGFDFLFACLRKIPIHVLPQWYVIPRATDDILNSIAEQYLATPKIYERYLSELVFKDTVAVSMMNDIFQSPDLKVRGSDLRKRYSLSRESFEEILLLLEFRLVCCLSYNQVGGQWEEVVTPFREWRDYLMHCRRRCIPMERPQQIRTHRHEEFAFVKEMSALLKAIEQAPLQMNDTGISLKMAATWLPELRKDFYRSPATYLQELLNKLLYLELAAIRQGELHLTPAAHWHSLSLEDQAMTLYRIPVKDLMTEPAMAELLGDRTLREIERGLRPAIGKGWLDLNTFIQSLAIPIGNAEPIALKRTGKRWRYEIPGYSALESQSLHWVIWQRLFEAGMVNTGIHGTTPCFSMTPFGQMMLGT